MFYFLWRKKLFEKWVSIVDSKKSNMLLTKLLIEKPIKRPRVPPTDPIKVIPSVMRYSSYILDFNGKANL